MHNIHGGHGQLPGEDDSGDILDKDVPPGQGARTLGTLLGRGQLSTWCNIGNPMENNETERIH